MFYGSTDVYLNDYLVALARTNGTQGEIIRKCLVRAELEEGCYAVCDEDIKSGVEIIELEFIKESP